mmetsp:Transcript_1276/g.2149  ORF Transcript_1276/g.2149 Transcript_1276/m.2149 type:complete len:485 (+) Transcript_1276:76-1530(+)
MATVARISGTSWDVHARRTKEAKELRLRIQEETRMAAELTQHNERLKATAAGLQSLIDVNHTLAAFELRACLAIWVSVVDLRQRDRAVERLTKHIDFLGGLLKPSATRYLKTLGAHAVEQVKAAYQDQLLEKKGRFIDRCLTASGSTMGNGACARTAFSAWNHAVKRRAVCKPRSAYILHLGSIVRVCDGGIAARWLQLVLHTWRAQTVEDVRQREVDDLRTLLAEQTERCTNLEARYNEVRIQLHYVCSAIDSGALTTSATPKSTTPKSTPRGQHSTPGSCMALLAPGVMTEVDAEEVQSPPESPITRPGHAGARLLTRSSSPVAEGAAAVGSRARASSGNSAKKDRSLSAAGASADALLQDMRALRKRMAGGAAEAKKKSQGSRQQRPGSSAESWQQYEQQQQLHSPTHSQTSSHAQWPLPSPPCVPPLSMVRAAAAVHENAIADLMSLNPDPAPVQCRGQCATPGRRPLTAEVTPQSAPWR